MDHDALNRIQDGNMTTDDVLAKQKARMIVNIGREAVAAFIVLFIFFKDMTAKAAGEPKTGSPAFTVGMILILVFAVVMMIRDILAVVMINNGKAESGFGQKFVIIAVATGRCIGKLVLAVAGAMIMTLGITALAGGLSSPEREKSMMMVFVWCGGFILAGLGAMAGSAVMIVAAAKKALEGQYGGGMA